MKLSYRNVQKQKPTTGMVLVTYKVSVKKPSAFPYTYTHKQQGEEHRTFQDHELQKVVKTEHAHVIVW